MAQAERAEDKWSKMLEDSVSKVQMEALTQIGRSYFRPPKKTLAEIHLGGPVRTRGTEERPFHGILRDKIIKKLQSEDPDMRAEAVLALVHWQDKETIEKIKEALRDSNRKVRLAAVQALASIRSDSFVESLLMIAQTDEDNLVRAKAISAIDWIGRGRHAGKQQSHAVTAVQTSGGGRTGRGSAGTNKYI